MAFERTKITLATLNNFLEVTAEMTDNSSAKAIPQLKKGYYPLKNSSFEIQYAEDNDPKGGLTIQVTNVIITNNLGNNKCIISSQDLLALRVESQGSALDLIGLVNFLTTNIGA